MGNLTSMDASLGTEMYGSGADLFGYRHRFQAKRGEEKWSPDELHVLQYRRRRAKGLKSDASCRRLGRKDALEPGTHWFSITDTWCSHLFRSLFSLFECRDGFKVQPSHPRGEESSAEGTRATQRQDHLPRRRLQLPRAPNRLEMFHLPFLSVSR